MKIMIASMTPVRFDALQFIRPALGLECECIVTASMPEEPDHEPVVVAQHKAWHVLERLMKDGYTDRRDGRYTFILTADCENDAGDGKLKGKADSVDTMALYVEDWERSARTKSPHTVYSGYALLVYHAHQTHLYSLDDAVRLYSRSQSVVSKWMHPVHDRFYDNQHIAHGFPTSRAFQDGDLVITDRNGNELAGREASFRAQGASPDHIYALFAAAYTDLVKKP